jgi:hypothetical protein
MTVEVLPHDEHNQKLVANVHPPDWVNPEPAARYNLVVLGAGPPGLVAAHAGNLISELTLAMGGGLGLRKIAAAIHPYPTQAEAIKKIGDAYNQARLTPFVKGLLEKWLGWYV